MSQGTNKRRRRQRTTESGAVSVEFALILVPFLILTFGLIQYGLFFYSAQSGSHVASRVIRQISVGNCQDETQRKTYALAQLGGATTAKTTAGITAEMRNQAGTVISTLPANSVGQTVKLRLEFPTINLHFPFLPFLNQAVVTRDVEARIEDTTDTGCPS